MSKLSLKSLVSSKPPEEDDDDEDKKTSRSSQDILTGLVVLVNLRLRLKFTRLLIYLFKLNLILYLILVEHIIWILFSRL